MRSYSFEGIVIKRQDFGEADKLVTVLSQHLGKITLLAKGIRKLSSRRAGSLELFNTIKASAVSGRGAFDVLAEVQALVTHPGWKKHLGRINLAYQLCEVVDKLLPDHEPQPRIYTTLASSLTQISSLDSGWQSQMDRWLMDILVDLGYWPQSQTYPDDISEYIESIIQHPLNSPKVLKKLIK